MYEFCLRKPRQTLRKSRNESKIVLEVYSRDEAVCNYQQIDKREIKVITSS